jgi:hypothetical protein
MQKARIPLTNFQYGEISPSLSSRTDSAIYNSSAQSVKNFFLMSEGGVQKRGGFKAIHDFTDVTEDTSVTQQVRIIPFNFSDDEQYVVALSNGKAQFFFIHPATGAVTSVATVTTDINSATVPWTQQYLHEITYAQGGDILFLAHPTFQTQQIVRTGLSSFEVQPFEFQVRAGGAKTYQPYFQFQASGVTLDPSDTSGSITVTTSAAYFDTTGKHNGVKLYYHGSEITIHSVSSSTSATATVTDELFATLDADAVRTVDGSANIKITQINHGMTNSDSITIRNATSVGGINQSAINGTRTIVSIIDENVFEVTADSSANTTEDGGGNIEIVTHAATQQWYEQSYSEVRGYPAAVGFHENRLWFGGTLSQPDTVWASKSGLYYNFDIGTALDNDSIELVMSIGEVATIRHFVSNRDIHIFTAGSEFSIPTFQNQAITPTNAVVKRQTSFGSSFSRPQPFYGATLFTQFGGSTIRQFIYSEAEAAYKSDPISLLSTHLIKNPIQSAVTISEVGASDAAVFFLNSDGSLVTYNLNRVENIAGWTKFETNGKFHSIASVADHLFAVLSIDMGSGANSYMLCQLDESANLDCADEYTGTAGVFNVSNFFEDGAIIDVVNGSDYLGKFTVSGGNLDVSAIDPSLTSCETGFAFEVELKTNPIDVNTSVGPETGRQRTIGSVTVNLSNTLSASVNGTKLLIRKTNSDFSQQRTPFNGNKEFRLLGYNRDPQVTLTQTAPLSLQVNGLVAELSF